MKILIIEDQQQVAVAIEHQVQQIKRSHVDYCISVAQAIDRISAARNAPYDLILCDYNLGECTNGQQLLEYLRSEKRIPRQTAFIMLTAEAQYSDVASAVELAPDAYLLKPFTLDGLEQRVNFSMAKREALKPAYKHIDCPAPDLPAAVKECNAIILAASRFALEALKLKAECLIKMEQWGEAANVYDKIIAWRPTAWAEVGRARTLRLMGHPELAEEKLSTTQELFPQFLAVYDELAALAEEKGDTQRAQEILSKAHAIVPSNRRTRGLGLLALQNGDLEKAAQLLKIITERDRYGLKRSTEDFFGLSTALRLLNRHDEAMEVLTTIKNHFPETRPLTVRTMAASAITLAAANRPFDAKKLVKEALELRTETMEPRTQLELGEACNHCGETETAQQIFLHVAENWQEDPKVVALVKKTLDRVGMGEDGNAMVDQAARDLTAINNGAAKKIKEGHFSEAVADMEKLAKRLPSHPTVQANYVQALLLWVEHEAPANVMELPHHSKPRQSITLAREHLRQLSKISPNHPRLAPLRRLFAKLTGEISADAGVSSQSDPQEAASMETEG